jgi:hypothetical protein
VLHMFGRERSRDQRRPHRPRRDRIHPNPPLLEIGGERARERDDRALGRCIVDQMRAAPISRDRGGVDDRRAGRQMGERRLGNMEHGEEIGPKGVLQLLGADVLEPVLRMLLAGIVDQQVESAERLDRTRDRVLAERLVADVARDDDAAAALLLDQRPGRRGIFMVVEVDDRNVGALLGEADRDRGRSRCRRR